MPVSYTPPPLADYALLSNSRTAALVSRDGAVDWLCLPRFDRASVFGALLGDATQGQWHLRPTDSGAEATRRYDGDTFILVTRWSTPTGIAEVRDFLVVPQTDTKRMSGSISCDASSASPAT